jgi:hypothetical protein
MDDGRWGVVTSLGAVGGGAAAGLLAGAVAGPVVAGIGALVGAVLGGLAGRQFGRRIAGLPPARNPGLMEVLDIRRPATVRPRVK